MPNLIAFCLIFFLFFKSFIFSQNETSSESKSTPSQDVNQNLLLEKKKNLSPHTFSGSTSFVSDYRVRGVSQTLRKPAVQGVMEYSYKNRVYFGIFGSNVDGTSQFFNNTGVELDFYGGLKGTLFSKSSPLIYNTGLIYYLYPGGKSHNSKNVRYNTLEYMLEFTYHWLRIRSLLTLTDFFGVNNDSPPFNWKKNRSARPNGNSVGSFYIEANATFDLWNEFSFLSLKGGKLILLLHVGHQTVSHYNQISYWEWRIDLTQAFSWFNVFVSYVSTNGKHAYFDILDHSFHPKKYGIGSPGIVVGVTRSF